MMLSQILADTQSESVLIWTLVLTSAGSLATGIFALVKQTLADRQAVKLREQDRLDKAAEAQAVLNALHAQELKIRLEASQREQRIVAKIDHNTEKTVEGIAKSEQALEAANNVNQKIETHASNTLVVAEATREATQQIAAATKLVAAKLDVETGLKAAPLSEE